MDTAHVAPAADAHFTVTHQQGARLVSTSRVLSAAEHQCFASARTMLERARQIADETIAWADAGYRKACAQGYEAGLAQARAQASQEALGLAAQRAAALRALQDRLAELVGQVLTRFLGEMDASERLGYLVRQGLEHLALEQGKVCVVVAPEQCEPLAAWRTRWSSAWPRLDFQIVADATIGPLACRIETADGKVEGDLRRQLDALNALCAGTTECAAAEFVEDAHV